MSVSTLNMRQADTDYHVPSRHPVSNSGPSRGNRARASRRRTTEPAVGDYTKSLMELVEAQILSRLETPSGRKILLEEAVYYGNDLEAAKQAIVKCARRKVRRKLTDSYDDQSFSRGVTPHSATPGPSNSGTSSTSGSNSSIRSWSSSKSGFSSGNEDDRAKLDEEIAAEAEALGLRAEDIPFAAANLSKVNMRLSREATRHNADNDDSGGGPFSSPQLSPSRSPARSAQRIGSGRGPVFGKPLELALYCNANPLQENRRVPDVVQVSLDYLNTYALSTEGLWRIPGNVGKVKEFKQAWDMGVGVNYANERTRPHDVCSLLLMYFRELPGTIFGEDMRRRFVNDQEITDEELIVDRLSGLVSSLPEPNRDTLNAMIRHFMLLAANSEENMMTSENIATCVWASQGYYQSMKHMIDNYDLIFYMYSS
mmetsp:Transcript_44866/g.65943  ORF Transcript_44866/g.65943 Transcript_44866/m.65943 type:complete len:426 (-) Transcript_44866:63-1340(-)|eukprot:CAMPEP_0195518488 /NCGR_PEP_ID=MMETSP0794_2-20130614/12981_1 /TAXON_ID=515487 /ORGANISM="Stephanopyxis turris, Strain CCMP 815" /LENGTH=425 /DNA_ID=CAMNT_0040647457 /DNA_START=265 /DNA_END=1542 /DNA_ORIENTATION=+